MKHLAVFIIAISSLFGVTKTNAQVAVGVQIGIAPPAIPVYAQPPCPVEGYLWTPGYWAYGPDGYYWVQGVWVNPPRIGFLWTPGYWGFVGGFYGWHGGYWGPHVGFYGGVNYGFGYGGVGFYGGRWDGGAFRYNTAVWRVNSGFHNTYVDRAGISTNVTRVSFNGQGGVMATPTPAERSAMTESHVPATIAQQNHAHSASLTRGQLASANGGHPSTTARSSVGGQRYNSSGSAIHAANTSRAATNNQHGTQSRAGGQAQRGATQNRGGAGSRGFGGGRSAGGGGRSGRH